MTARPIKHKDWIAEACTLFGNDMVHWVFVCPVCEHEASCGDFAKVHGPVPLDRVLPGRRGGTGATRLLEEPHSLEARRLILEVLYAIEVLLVLRGSLRGRRTDSRTVREIHLSS